MVGNKIQRSIGIWYIWYSKGSKNISSKAPNFAAKYANLLRAALRVFHDVRMQQNDTFPYWPQRHVPKASKMKDVV
jgi:hypothetical protein